MTIRKSVEENKPERKSRFRQIKRRHRCQMTPGDDFDFSRNKTFVNSFVLHADQSFVLVHQRLQGCQGPDVQRRQLEFGQIEEIFR